MSDKWGQIQGAYVFGEVHGSGMVGGMGGDGFGVVIDAGDDLGTLLSMETCGGNAGGGASGAAEEVNV